MVKVGFSEGTHRVKSSTDLCCWSRTRMGRELYVYI